MKKSFVTLLGILALGTVAYGGQAREFWNTDKSKSFNGSLVSFDEASNKVVVRTAKGKLINFSADNLCEDDQEYVAKQGPLVALVENVRIRMQKNEGKLDSSKSGGARFSKRDIEYQMFITNDGDEIQDLEIRYTMLYDKGVEKGESILKTHTGTIEIETLLAKRVSKRLTSALTLERMIKPPSSTGG